jgi:dGTPase
MEIVTRAAQVEREEATLCAQAALSASTEGRARSTHADALRNEFQRDRDKILHTKSFRRLSHKTQVFLAAEGDHFRTRLTHTLEVSQIARTIARALGLNEDLTEAISLGHDLGHTPFGHTGEEALSKCISNALSGKTQNAAAQGGEGVTGVCTEAGGSAGGASDTFGSAAGKCKVGASDTFGSAAGAWRKSEPYRHNEQSLRVVEVIENGGAGLNLTFEVRDGILHHTGSQPAETLEGRIVAVADRIAYVNHDIDDAIRAGILLESDLPASTHARLGTNHSARIQTLVTDMVETSAQVGDIRLSAGVWEAMQTLRAFLFEHVYQAEVVMVEVEKAQRLLTLLFDYYMANPAEIPSEYHAISGGDTMRAVVDYIAGMTDRFAKAEFTRLFLPNAAGGVL